MKNGLTPELLEQAKTATSAAELLALAAEKGIELTPAEAASHYVQLHPKSGALPDEELDNVAGGVNGCYNQTDGRLIVTEAHRCDHWTCRRCQKSRDEHFIGGQLGDCSGGGEFDNIGFFCDSCKLCSIEGLASYCNHPANRRQ